MPSKIIPVFSAGFLLGFGIGGNMFDLYPIDWNGVGALMTFLAVCVAFFQNWAYRRRENEIERREILEKIIQPLIIDLKEIVKTVPEFSLSQFRWQQISQGNPYLIRRGLGDLQKNIERFDDECERFKRIVPPLIKHLNESFFEETMRFLNERGFHDDANAMTNIGQRGPWYMRHLIVARTESQSTTFLSLIFHGITAKQYFEMIRKRHSDPITDNILLNTTSIVQ